MKLDRSVARKTIASVISPGAAGRPAGACAASWSRASPIASVPSVRVGPGVTVLTRTPLGPYSARPRFGEEINGGLARSIKAHARHSVIGNHCRYIDDCTFTSLGHQRGKFRDQEIRRLDV